MPKIASSRNKWTGRRRILLWSREGSQISLRMSLHFFGSFVTTPDPLLQTCHQFFEGELGPKLFSKVGTSRDGYFFTFLLYYFLVKHSRRKSFLLRIRNRGFSGGEKGVQKKKEEINLHPDHARKRFLSGETFRSFFLPFSHDKEGIREGRKGFPPFSFPHLESNPPLLDLKKPKPQVGMKRERNRCEGQRESGDGGWDSNVIRRGKGTLTYSSVGWRMCASHLPVKHVR